MRKRRILLLVVLVLVGVPFTLLLAALLSDALMTAAWWLWPTPPVGTILIYEIDPTLTPNPTAVDMDKLVAAIDERLNPGWHKGARVRQLDDGRIEIGVFGNDPEQVRRIERIVERAGTLEFRILANSRDHAALVKRALADNTGVLRDNQGNVEAWWVPVQQGQEKDFQDHLRVPESRRVVVIRERLQDGKKTLELLVVKDPFDVTGTYLTDVARDTDSEGNPCILVTLDSTGARLFGGLTSLNLPDEVQGFYRELGIILDGKLYSAPRLKSTIYDRALIEGSFTEEEVQDMVSVLNAGSLPAAVRLVEKRRVSPEQ